MYVTKICTTKETILSKKTLFVTHKSVFSPKKKPVFLHACAGCTELPANISTVVPGITDKSKDALVHSMEFRQQLPESQRIR